MGLSTLMLRYKSSLEWYNVLIGVTILSTCSSGMPIVSEGPKAPTTIQQIGEILSGILSSDWLQVLQHLWDFLRSRFFSRHQAEALYEILDYDLTLDLLDPKGKVAFFRRRQRVRILQNHVIAYQDEAWGDGSVVASYFCSPGVPVDIFRSGSRYLILISLRQTRNRNDVVEFNIERKVKDGFTKRQEWLEVETRYPTKRLHVTIIFPRGRPCQKAWLSARRKNHQEELDASHFSNTSAGNQVLSWELARSSYGETYTICWKW
jgi:hypothetical protein